MTVALIVVNRVRKFMGSGGAGFVEEHVLTANKSRRPDWGLVAAGPRCASKN